MTQGGIIHGQRCHSPIESQRLEKAYVMSETMDIPNSSSRLNSESVCTLPPNVATMMPRSLPDSGSLIFRPAKSVDLPIVISWLRDAVDCRRWAGPAVTFPPTTESLSREISFTPDNSFSLDEVGELIGFGQLIRKTRKRLHTSRIIVAPHRRGDGLGRNLCRALIERTIELGYPRLSLYVYQDNPAAIHLYQGLGFQETEKPEEDKLVTDTVYMELDLEPCLV
jgi:ribosomal protein S18 acetylase RimI-like enzyme